nr:unnamed protein product [Callosobruchus analis]
MQERSYAALDQSCQEVQPEVYICKTQETKPIDDNAPCEVQLLTRRNNQENCHPISIHIQSVKVEEIKSNLWLVINPKSLPLETECKGVPETLEIPDSAVIQSHPECKLKIGKNVIPSGHKNMMRKFFIPDLQLQKNVKIENTRLNLENLNISSLHEETIAMEMLKRKAEEIDPVDPLTWYSGVSTTALIIIGIIVTLLIIYKKNQVQRKKKMEAKEEIPMRTSQKDIGVKATPVFSI